MILLTSLLGIWHFSVTLSRIDGQMLDANVYAITQYLAFFLLLSMADAQTKGRLIIINSVLFLILIAFFASNSRSGTAAWLGAFGGIIVLSMFKPLYSRKTLVTVGLLSLFAFALVALLPVWFGDGSLVRGLDDLSHLNSRTYIWGATWELIKSMPLMGYGLGTFANLYPAVRYEYGSSGVFAHNDYLQLLLEGGPLLLGLLLAYVMFYGWLGFKVFFEKNEVIERQRAEYKELLSYIAIAMALSAHAILNYVFYVLSIQIIVGVVLARTVLLARQLGYLKVPALHYRKLTFIVPCIMMIMVLSLSVLAVSRKALLHVGHFPIPEAWNESPEFAQNILTVDPDNQAANMLLFNQLFFGLSSAPERQRQAMFEVSFRIGKSLMQDYPYDSDYYWRQGFLIEQAIALGLDTHSDEEKTPEEYYQQALKLNPGNIHAIQSMFDYWLTKGDIDEVVALMDTAMKWKSLLSLDDRKLLAEMRERLEAYK
ncbi:O-antigen ligase family protein [uncultured Endozoicomonas sp.]|uniref:O-antigen ligase family protein n=1 Tax=uncultured Endozoicomonas sp. TaxID=432652 RepID=UPI00261413D7|nr:O-antigen ligase family protein [uncultured Endozoicomonas sp.]